MKKAEEREDEKGRRWSRRGEEKKDGEGETQQTEVTLVKLEV